MAYIEAVRETNLHGWSELTSMRCRNFARQDSAAGIPPHPCAVQLANATFGKTVVLPSAGLELGEAILGQYVGEYSNGAGKSAIVSLEDARLYAQPAGGSKRELFPSSDAKFAFARRDSPLQFTFDKDEAGNIVSVTLSQNGAQQVLKKAK